MARRRVHAPATIPPDVLACGDSVGTSTGRSQPSGGTTPGGSDNGPLSFCRVVVTMRVASLPIDVAGHIAAAYRRRPPPHPVMTELPDCHRPAHATSGCRPRWQQLPFLVPAIPVGPLPRAGRVGARRLPSRRVLLGAGHRLHRQAAPGGLAELPGQLALRQRLTHLDTGAVGGLDQDEQVGVNTRIRRAFARA
jgi:hypothetical protein